MIRRLALAKTRRLGGRFALCCLAASGLDDGPRSQAAAPAEQPPLRSSGSVAPTGESLPSTLPYGAYQTPPVPGVPYSKIFRDTGAPYTNPLNRIAVTPSVQTESVEARATLGLPSINAAFPLLQRGFEPQDADLKFGPVFFKLQGLSAAGLWSDNINLTASNRESGTIGILTISGAIIAQLTEGLRIAVSGSFIYLPLQNEAGIAGFGLYGSYLLGLDDQPIVRSEITWNTIIGGWNVVFADDFRIGIGRFSSNVRDDAILFNGGGFNGYDQAGRYVFRGPQDPTASKHRSNNERSDTSILYYSNIVSAQADRLIVAKTRLRVQASHENLWYNQGSRGLPGLRDQINVSLVSERENLRFKPFIIYQALKTDLQASFEHTIRAGLDGPITDQLQLHVEVGYYYGNNQDAFLWGVSLRHQAGPYTEESLFFGRAVSSFHDEINEIVGYNIRQILGPKIIASAFILRDDIHDLSGEGFSRVEYRTGLQFSINAGPRTNIILTGTYALVESAGRQSNTLTGRVEVSHYFTDSFVARLIYQYQESNADLPNQNYYENLIYFSLTKYFN